MNILLPKPVKTSISKPFWDGIAKGRFSLQFCDDCSRAIFYPRGHCPHCFSDQLTWKEASGQGRLKTWSIIYRTGHPAWQEKTPYVVGVVELADGPSMLTHLLIEPSEITYQMQVSVCFTTIEGEVLPFFKAKGEETP
ncbi:Zn-ribbon domain-containing OB-fold protein [Lentibacillus salicampi]|uniref:Zn-ribbon domain-containing OB-fold protein n=1 Tax=Lentibacillus salicampi TaxID=175306 RepID=A0A4Y9A9F4_9BACI|nr:OB-fold domain-containing protein [Lentibacillus salicampi]TFJ92105.1 hypothetical protein E4U82_14070 [Lentibacillus salicampi]